jgi:hypothetical protein
MTATTPGVAKTAIDSTAKDYWSSYFGPYGKELVRDIKKRVLAALHTAKRTASADGEIRPLAFVRMGEGFTIEAAVRSGDQRLLICAALDAQGNVLAIRGLDARGGYFDVEA